MTRADLSVSVGARDGDSGDIAAVASIAWTAESVRRRKAVKASASARGCVADAVIATHRLLDACSQVRLSGWENLRGEATGSHSEVGGAQTRRGHDGERRRLLETRKSHLQHRAIRRAELFSQNGLDLDVLQAFQCLKKTVNYEEAEEEEVLRIDSRVDGSAPRRAWHRTAKARQLVRVDKLGGWIGDSRGVVSQGTRAELARRALIALVTDTAIDLVRVPPAVLFTAKSSVEVLEERGLAQGEAAAAPRADLVARSGRAVGVRGDADGAQTCSSSTVES
eukprot:scaffold2708_cov158-Ochromonas_danica.AAC.39